MNCNFFIYPHFHFHLFFFILLPFSFETLKMFSFFIRRRLYNQSRITFSQTIPSIGKEKKTWTVHIYCKTPYNGIQSKEILPISSLHSFYLNPLLRVFYWSPTWLFVAVIDGDVSIECFKYPMSLSFAKYQCTTYTLIPLHNADEHKQNTTNSIWTNLDRLRAMNEYNFGENINRSYWISYHYPRWHKANWGHVYASRFCLLRFFRSSLFIHTHTYVLGQ